MYIHGTYVLVYKTGSSYGKYVHTYISAIIISHGSVVITRLAQLYNYQRELQSVAKGRDTLEREESHLALNSRVEIAPTCTCVPYIARENI